MKILVAASYPMIRKGITAIISECENIESYSEASTKLEALSIISSFKPDIALIDATLGNNEVLELISELKQEKIHTKFILIGFYGNPEFIYTTFKLGVEGYILREASSEEILYAIRYVYQGKRYYDSNLLDYIVNRNKIKEIPELTERERQVLQELAKGLSNKQIANRFFITENTVKKHVGQILSKLKLTDRTQAAIYAHNRGIVS